MALKCLLRNTWAPALFFFRTFGAFWIFVFPVRFVKFVFSSPKKKILFGDLMEFYENFRSLSEELIPW